MENGKQSSDAEHRRADLQSSSRPEASKSHLALLPPGARRTDRAVRGSLAESAALCRAEAEGGELAASSRAFSVSPRCAHSLAAARPGFSAPLPSRVSSLPPALLHSPRLGPARASCGCPAGTASQPGLPPPGSRVQSLVEESGNRKLRTQRKRLLAAPAEGQA